MYLKDGWVLEIGDYYIHSFSYNDLGCGNINFCEDVEEATVFTEEEVEEVNDMLLSLNIYAKAIEIEMYGSPKQVTTKERDMEWLDDNEFYCHTTAETALEKAVDKGELSCYGTKCTAARKPVIPQFVAKWYESEGKRDSWWNWFYKWGRDKSETELEAKTIKWMQDYNEGLFVDMFRYGYEVEEQKYYAKIKGWQLFVDFIGTKYWGASNYGRPGFVSVDDAISITEDEWNEVGINDRNAELVPAEELENKKRNNT